MRLYGKNPVLERIKINPASIHKVYLQKGTDLSEIVREMKKTEMKFESVDKIWFKKECAELHAQGVLAEVEEFKYTQFQVLKKECIENKTCPVFLDELTDPQNLGSILRTLACMGGFSVVLPEHDSVHVTESVLRVANGGENYIKIAKVVNVATAIKTLKDEGVWVAGACFDEAEDIQKTVFKFPMALVIGSEGKGVRPGVRKVLDAEVVIPMNGARLSYNAAIATALFCYEINRRERF